MERTLSIIKPDAVKQKVSGKIISMFEDNGFNVIAMRKTHLTKEQAMEFYAVHKDKKFYGELVDFMTSGSCIAMVLEKKNAIAENRKLMGATNPAEAESNTIRKLYGKSIDSNTVHGSDSLENAINEINFFFSTEELVKLSQ